MTDPTPETQADSTLLDDLRRLTEGGSHRSLTTRKTASRALAALTEATEAIEAALNVCNDDDYAVGGAWGDYGETVVAAQDVRKALGIDVTPRQPGEEFAVTIRDLRAATIAAEARDAYHANEWRSAQLVIAISEEREAFLESQVGALVEAYTLPCRKGCFSGGCGPCWSFGCDHHGPLVEALATQQAATARDMALLAQGAEAERERLRQLVAAVDVRRQQVLQTPLHDYREEVIALLSDSKEATRNE